MFNKLTYENIKRCMIFRDSFTNYYNAHQFNLAGLVYEKLYNIMQDFEYCLNSGILDDPSGPEYGKCLQTIKKVMRLIEKTINSEYRLSDKHVLDLMLETYDILQKIFKDK